MREREIDFLLIPKYIFMPQQYAGFIQPQGLIPVQGRYIHHSINLKEIFHNRRNELISLPFTHKGVSSVT